MQIHFNYFHFLDQDGLIDTTKTDDYESRSTKPLPKVGDVIKNRYEEKKQFYNVAYAIDQKKNAVLYVDDEIRILNLESQLSLIEENLSKFLKALYSLKNKNINRPIGLKKYSFIKALEYTGKLYFEKYKKSFNVEYKVISQNKEKNIEILRKCLNTITSVLDMVNINEEVPRGKIALKTMLLTALYSTFSLVYLYEEIKYKNKNSSVLMLTNKKIDEDYIQTQIKKVINGNFSKTDILNIESDASFFASEQYEIQRKVEAFN